MESERYENLIRDYIDRMPPSLAQAIGSMDLPDKIQTIGRNSSLRLDQLGVVERELFMVLLGVEHPDAFRANVMREARLTNEEAARVTADANALVIAPIRSALVDMHEKEKLEREILQMMPDSASDEMPAAATPAAAPQQQPAPVTFPSAARSEVPSAVPQPSAIPPVRTLGTDIAQTKLSGDVHLPPDAVKMKETPSAAMPSGIQKPPSPVQNNTYTHGSDPYREPIK